MEEKAAQDREDTAAPDREEKAATDREEKVNLYPNCDATIWLRTLKKEVLVPIQGQVKGNSSSCQHEPIISNKSLFILNSENCV